MEKCKKYRLSPQFSSAQACSDGDEPSSAASCTDLTDLRCLGVQRHLCFCNFLKTTRREETLVLVDEFQP